MHKTDKNMNNPKEITKNLLKGETCESCLYSTWYKDDDHVKYCYGNPEFQNLDYFKDGWCVICGKEDGGYIEHAPIPEIRTCLEYVKFQGNN